MPERPCTYCHPDPAETSATCRLCWLVLNDGRYTALWATASKPIAKPAPPARCVNLGEATGATRPCRTCNGKTKRIKVYDCQVYALCVLGGEVGLPVCSPKCDGYEAKV